MEPRLGPSLTDTLPRQTVALCDVRLPVHPNELQAIAREQPVKYASRHSYELICSKQQKHTQGHQLHEAVMVMATEMACTIQEQDAPRPS